MNYSKIISGTMNWGAWGSNLSTKKVADLIVNSIEFGINTFDNADIYGGYTTEELFGNGLAESGIKRERIKIISKFGIMYPSDKLPVKVKHYDYSKGHIVKSIENSLKNLKTDYIDCVLLHRLASPNGFLCAILARFLNYLAFHLPSRLTALLHPL